jgi:membrane protein
MSKNWISRLTRIISDRFGSEKEDGFSLESSLNHFERFVHFWVLVCRSFVRNRCPVRASALSYTTLLALIPMLAVAMSATSIFLKSEGKERITHFIESVVDNIVPNAPAKTNQPPAAVLNNQEHTNSMSEAAFSVTSLTAADYGSNSIPSINLTTNSAVAGTTSSVGKQKVKDDVSKEVADYIHKFVENTYSGTLGITGMIFLLLTAILTLTRVEETFNDIWGVTRGRDWWSRITNYFFTIVMGPALCIGALGMANGSGFQKTKDVLSGIPFAETLLSTWLPVIVICFTLAMLYKLVPNTRVDFSAALVGGTLAGLAWHGYTRLGFLLASFAVKTNAIYGALATIPLLMGGLYVVWLTILFGAQVAYAFQNRAAYLQDKLAENVNQRGREFVALRLMTCIGQRFNRGQKPVTIREISTELGSANVARRASRRRNRRHRGRLLASATARHYQLSPRTARHARHARSRTSHARRTGAHRSPRRIRTHPSRRTRGRHVSHDACARQSRPSPP